MQFATAYSKKPKNYGISFPKEEGRTKQAHKDESDINNIMRKFTKTGIIEHSNNHSADYGFATSDDLHSSLLIVKKAEQMFAALPSAARNKFKNDPGEFLDFVQNEENKDKLFDLGLSDKPYIQPKSEEDTQNVDSGLNDRRAEDFDPSD